MFSIKKVDRVAIIGLGLIGGSLAIDLRKRGFATHIIGVDSNLQHAQIALESGLVNVVLPMQEAIATAELTLLAVPVNVALRLLPQILDSLPSNATVADMGSTKQAIVQLAEQHPKRAQFVATHPMAGTEFSGPTAAIPDLFDGKVAIICNPQHSRPEAIDIIEQMYAILQMPLVYMDAAEHDIHAAYVSHISHISSFVLANAVLEKERSVSAIFNLASGGFASTVRLAKSSPVMWSQIFEQNSRNVLEVLDTYIANLLEWRGLIATGNFSTLENLMLQANSIKKILDVPPLERLKKQEQVLTK